MFYTVLTARNYVIIDVMTYFVAQVGHDAQNWSEGIHKLTTVR